VDGRLNNLNDPVLNVLNLPEMRCMIGRLQNVGRSVSVKQLKTTPYTSDSEIWMWNVSACVLAQVKVRGFWHRGLNTGLQG